MNNRKTNAWERIIKIKNKILFFFSLENYNWKKKKLAHKNYLMYSKIKKI